mgnify:CR=1 FL=1
MTSREHVRALIAGEPVERCAFWLGKPPQETQDKLNAVLGTSALEDIQRALGDDVRWITPQHGTSTYRHPQGLSMRPWRDANPHGLSGKGLLSDATTRADMDRVAFPDAQYLEFSETLALLDACGPFYRLSGFWSPFFHDLCYLFGTEELLTLLLIEPEMVRAALDRICGFYYQANERFYAAAGDRIDALFFGNDFGTQNGLLMSPAVFRAMFLPWIERFAAQAHQHGHACVLHCCGGISDIIDDLISAGVDCLHPLQTRAAGMEPEQLARRFARRVVFMGGVDTQELLVHSTADDVKAAVQHLRRVFGERIIIGPSHEALLPNVNAHNVLAMASAALPQ